MANELDEAALSAIAREAERLPTDYRVIEPLLIRDCYEGQESSPWMGHTRPAAEAYASVPALIATIRSLRAEVERLRQLEEQSNYQQIFTDTNVGDD